MVSKKMSAALVAASMVFGAGVAQAQPFTTLGNMSVKPMSAEQMKAVEGKAHVYLLLESLGVELNAKAEAATRAAAPTPQNNGAGGSDTFVRSPSRDAAAFVNALGAPGTPTRQ